MSHPIAIVLHLLSAVVWVGGMFFAYLILRPVAGGLEPPQRLTLWSGVLARFFRWVWLAILLLLASGYWLALVTYGGFRYVGLHVHLMQGLGILMMLLFGYVYFAPFRRLQSAVKAEDWPAAGLQLGRIRRIVGINLILGLIVVTIGGGGRYLPMF